MTDRYTADPDAIRDVAATDMQSIVDDLERARLELFSIESDAAAAFTEGSINVLGSEIASFGPFRGVESRWREFTEVLAQSLSTSEERVQDAAESLLRIAEDYERFDAQSAADFHSFDSTDDR
ncbi:hypothetical protein B0I28_107126 [Glycomyces artemisiae]|uniref:Excreted virulence factor EspC (Type VII ESX diderm) n=2 Tax=Glycomyces artemisiae TaxID=1076443 RepID=A0A2T0UHE4_9ACTN|nr:hypothetical protein B0I28_107126 [Glycomyces artemisiae]